jgi:hypothetical protein
VSKELYMDAHEQLVDEYLEAHPNATWAQAYDRTADAAYDRMTDNLADAADHYRDMMKERGL